MIFLISAFISLGTFFLALLILVYAQKKIHLDPERRMRRHNIKVSTKKNKDFADLLLRGYAIIQKIAKPLVEKNFAQSLEYKMRQAGLPILGGEFVVIAAISSLFLGLIVYLITLDSRIALLVILTVPLILWAVVLFLISRRLESFTSQLGDSLLTISNALRAGYSFQQAVEVISTEMEPPIGEEFSRIYHDIVMGVSLEEALETANKRIGSSDFELVVTAVLIQREVGGNLAQILDNISYTINERIRMKGEIKSLTAQGRFSALILLCLPFAAGAAMFFMNHDNFMMLFEEPLGQIALGVSFVMEIVGYFVIMRIVDIDV